MLSSLRLRREMKKKWLRSLSTGDAFSSVITGCLLNGDSLPEAIERAVHFINMGIKATFGYAHNPLDGMNQEKVLHYLNKSLPYFTYELLPG